MIGCKSRRVGTTEHIWEASSGGDQGFKRICHVGMHRYGFVKERGLRMWIPDFVYGKAAIRASKGFVM